MAREYILKLLENGQQAIKSIDKGDLQRAKGYLNEAKDRLIAAEILLNEEINNLK